MRLSKYNYYTKNKQNELLLFNTLSGTSSFIKISSGYSEPVKQALCDESKISSLKKSVYNELVKNYYIIPDDMDEKAKLLSIYLSKVSDSQLLLTLIPTEQCNFRCKYCYESFPDNVMSTEVQDSILLYLKKNLNRYSSLHISWFGGEPLLAIDIIESMSEKIKKICAFYKKPFTASMTTNGFLLDIDNFKKLLKCNVIYYQITIDGTKEIHDVQRPHSELKISTYDKIIDNLKHIKDEIRSGIFKITIRSNFSRFHLNRIDEYKQTIYELFGDDKRFQFFVRPVMDWGGDSINNFKDNLVDNKELNDFYDKLMSSDYKLNYIYDDLIDFGGGVCYAGKKNTYLIKTNGDIYKCTCHFQNCPKAKIGVLNSDGNMDISNDQNKWLCNFSECNKDCFYSPICLRDPCSAINVLKNGIGKKCPLEKRSLSKILQLLDSENNLFRRID